MLGTGKFHVGHARQHWNWERIPNRLFRVIAGCPAECKPTGTRRTAIKEFTTVSSHITQDLVVVVDTPNHLFNAPDINPFSENVLETLGVSGLTYIVRQLQAHRRDWKNIRLVVQMPPDQITPGFELRLTEALRRYCRTKIEDNTIEIHRIRFRSSIGLGILAAIVAALIIAAYLLFTGVLASAPQAVQVTIAATISLFAWVSL